MNTYLSKMLYVITCFIHLYLDDMSIQLFPIPQTSVIFSKDKCPGSLCHSPSIGIRFSASVSVLDAWTKTLSVTITFKPLKKEISYMYSL